jgi:hypothetical protein
MMMMSDKNVEMATEKMMADPTAMQMLFQELAHHIQNWHISCVQRLHDGPCSDEHRRARVSSSMSPLHCPAMASGTSESAYKRPSENVGDLTSAQVLGECMEALHDVELGLVKKDRPIPVLMANAGGLQSPLQFLA